MSIFIPMDANPRGSGSSGSPGSNPKFLRTSSLGTNARASLPPGAILPTIVPGTMRVEIKTRSVDKRATYGAPSSTLNLQQLIARAQQRSDKVSAAKSASLEFKDGENKNPNNASTAINNTASSPNPDTPTKDNSQQQQQQNGSPNTLGVDSPVDLQHALTSDPGPRVRPVSARRAAMRLPLATVVEKGKENSDGAGSKDNGQAGNNAAAKDDQSPLDRYKSLEAMSQFFSEAKMARSVSDGAVLLKKAQEEGQISQQQEEQNAVQRDNGALLSEKRLNGSTNTETSTQASDNAQ
jgi:hypothetical protein